MMVFKLFYTYGSECTLKMLLQSSKSTRNPNNLYSTLVAAVRFPSYTFNTLVAAVGSPFYTSTTPGYNTPITKEEEREPKTYTDYHVTKNLLTARERRPKVSRRTRVGLEEGGREAALRYSIRCTLQRSVVHVR